MRLVMLGMLMVGLMLGARPSIAQTACATEAGGVLTSTLTWTDADTVDPVGILRGTTTGGPYTQIATAPAASLTYTDPITAPATGSVSYYYVVNNQSAASGTSPNSNEGCKTFFAKPSAPANLIVK